MAWVEIGLLLINFSIFFSIKPVCTIPFLNSVFSVKLQRKFRFVLTPTISVFFKACLSFKRASDLSFPRDTILANIGSKKGETMSPVLIPVSTRIFGGKFK